MTSDQKCLLWKLEMIRCDWSCHWSAGHETMWARLVSFILCVQSRIASLLCLLRASASLDLSRPHQCSSAPWWLFVVWAGAHQSHSWRQSSHKILASAPLCSSLHWQYNICLRLTHTSIPEHDNVVTHWAEAATFQPINPFPVWVCCHVVQFTTILLPTATRASVVQNIPVW